MNSHEKFDAVVIGTGPIASILAILLKRKNLNVLQLTDLRCSTDRPNEILSIQAINILSQFNLRLNNIVSSHCSGVLKKWESDIIGYIDYKLISTRQALTITPKEYSKQFLTLSFNEGVIHKNINKHKGIELISNNSLKINHTEKLSFKYLFQATGRASTPISGVNLKRIYHNKQIALCFPVHIKKHMDKLIIEASNNGWWYIPSSPEGKSHIVFMTDSDIFPKNKTMRIKWIEQEFNASSLVSDLKLNVLDNFKTLKSVDARFSSLEDVQYSNWFAVGDLAIGLDPLSGNGHYTGLKHIEFIIKNIDNPEIMNSAYRDLISNQLKMEKAFHRQTYNNVLFKLHPKTFWKRRISIEKVDNPININSPSQLD